MLAENMVAVERFCMERQLNGLSPKTLKGYRILLRQLDAFLAKPFTQASKEDLMGFMAGLIEGYAPATVHLTKARLKAFFAWLHGCEPREYPPCVKWMRLHNPGRKGREMPVKPEDILTQAEVLKLIEACENTRDQALIATLYETGGRAEELLTMRVKSVQLDQPISHVTLEGKTGERSVPVKDCVAYILAWLNVHPRRRDREAPLWWSRQGGGRNISYYNLRRLMLEAKEKAGINKPVRPHLLRHMRATELAKVLPEHLHKQWFGWTPGSKMADVYTHLCGKDLDVPIKRALGLPIEEGETTLARELKPQECPRCRAECPPTHAYCFRCGLRLDVGIYMTDIEERDLWLNTYFEVIMERWSDKEGLPNSEREIADEVEARIQAKKRGAA